MYNNLDWIIPKLKQYQKKLTAGDNITIENNVISASGGGGGDGIRDVVVNGESVVTNRVAEIDLSDYALKTDLDDKANKSALVLTNKKLKYLAELTKGQAWDVEQGNSPVYQQSVPQGAKAVAIDSIGGKSLVFNQLQPNTLSRVSNGVKYDFSDGTLTVSEEVAAAERTGTSYWLVAKQPTIQTVQWIANHKYVCLGISDDKTHWYILSPEGQNMYVQNGEIFSLTNDIDNYLQLKVNATDDISIPWVFKPQIFDLTLMFGAGNEPSTVEEIEAMFLDDYYPYNEGEIVSAEVDKVVSRNADDEVIYTYEIPDVVKALDGYGEGFGDNYNYLDFEAKKFVKVGEWIDDTWTELAEPIETDISAYLTVDNLLTAEGGGTLTFEQSNSVSSNLAVPNGTEYAVNLSEAV